MNTMQIKKKPLLVRARNRLRNLLVELNLYMLRRMYSIQIGQGTIVSLKARLDKTHPQGLIIGQHCYISADAMVLTHDFINKQHKITILGNNVFLGTRCIVLPGITIANNVIVAAGSVVTKNIEETNVIVAGNPAKIVATDIAIGKLGQKVSSDVR